MVSAYTPAPLNAAHPPDVWSVHPLPIIIARHSIPWLWLAYFGVRQLQEIFVSGRAEAWPVWKRARKAHLGGLMQAQAIPAEADRWVRKVPLCWPLLQDCMDGMSRWYAGTNQIAEVLRGSVVCLPHTQKRTDRWVPTPAPWHGCGKGNSSTNGVVSEQPEE